ncbi:MAG: insulinase family protein [Candidatus Obscuribacterales bacterium]|nr:insulinase family protein [Candidatus Obscuribacterales bacterium]
MGNLHRSRQLRFMDFIGLSLAVSLQPLAFLSPAALAVVSPVAGKKVAAVSPATGEAAFQKVASDAATGITEYKLKSNGLSVLLAERHASPVVTVMVVYKVGSRNEAVGYTGSTHFLEHMMFKGTAKHDPMKGTGIDDVLKPTGAINNATTYYDRTLYYEVAPATALSTCLELEADRMQGALLRDSDRKSEMTVVRNELERNENYASTILDTLVFATAYREHPYHHPVIGWRSDVEGVPIERLRQFYKDFYYPDNATLVVIGDFKTREALNTISQYFGKVPKSPKPVPKVYTVEPPQEGERRFIVQRGDELPKVMIGYHIPKATDKDTWPLEVLASVLGDQSRQSSRLYKSLIDSGLASQVSAYNYSMRDPGLFTLFGSATPKTELPVIEKALKSEIIRLAKEPVSDTELERAKTAVWKKLKLDAADPSGLATQIAEAIAVADWKWWLSIEQKVKAVTKDDLQRVAAKYFGDKNSTTGYYLPREKKEEPAKELPKAEAVKPASLLAPMMEEYSAFAPPLPLKQVDSKSVKATPASTSQATIASKVKKKVLANGLTVLVYPIPGSGIAAVAGKIKGGQAYKPVDKTLVPEFVSEMLTKGSKGLSKEALADQIEIFGTHFSPDIENFFADFKSTVVSEDLGPYLKMVSTVFQHPDFSEVELDKAKKIKESELQDALSETSELAANNLLHNLYKPDSVYYQKSFPQQTDELKSITVEDLRNFHDKYYSPNNTILAIVGDVNPDKAFQLAEAAFSDWRKRPPSQSTEEKPIQWSAPKEKMLSVPVPDKSSVDIVMGRPVPISITSPEFHASQVANAALGHDTIASRLAVIREKHGLTYGVSSSFMDNAEKNSPWIVQLTVNPENTDKAMNLVKQIISDYRKTGITKQELQTEVKRLAGEYVVYRMRTPEQIADALTKYELLGLGPEFMDKHPQKLLQVTKEQVDEFVRKYMNINEMVTSVAGSITKAGSGKAETK